MSRCASCGQPITWAVTGNNRKPVPINPDPVPDGNIELRSCPDGQYAVTWGNSHTWPAGAPRYRSHLATCPQADRHRRPR